METDPTQREHAYETFVGAPEQIRAIVGVLAAKLGVVPRPNDTAPRLLVVGDGALAAHADATGWAYPGNLGTMPHINVSVAPDIFVNLRQKSDVERLSAPNGHLLGVLPVHGVAVHIDSGWGDTNHAALAQDALLLNGISVASLKEINRQKGERGEAEDLADMAFIDTMLKEKILPAHLLQKQISFINNLFPEELEHLKDHPLVTIAAHGLHMVDVLIDNNYYQGEVEISGVYAAYHGLEHTAGGLPVLLTHMFTVNARDEAAGREPTYKPLDILAALIAFAFHDAILGHGREAISGERCDEKRSAELIYNLVLAYGGGLNDEDRQYVAAAAKAGIEATAFTEGAGTQAVQYGSAFEHIQIGTAGADLATLYLWKGPSEALCVSGEDLMRHGMAGQFYRALGEVIETVGIEEGRRIRFRSPKDMFEFIDTYSNRVIPSDPEGRTLRDFLLLRLAGTIGFMRPGGFVFPEGWAGEDRKARIRNAYMVMYARAAIAAGGSVQDAFQITEGYRINGETHALAA